jgi:ribosome biogenesis GTPase A
VNIQWYPGHMTKARRQMEADLKQVSLVIELADARIPLGSRNPDIDRMAAGKDRLILLNKADMADPAENDAWVKWYAARNIRAVLCDARNPRDVKAIRRAVTEVSAERMERNRRKGILNRPVRAMVCGIPNVGKSTLINSVAGRSAAKTGNKPGVTRSNQWIRLDRTLELLDTPGILWPKFEDPEVSVRLALLGSISDQVVDSGELALELLKFMAREYPALLAGWRKSTDEEDGGDEMPELMAGDYAENAPYLRIMEREARTRGCLRGGGNVDYDRISAVMLNDFRAAKMGRITLEKATV